MMVRVPECKLNFQSNHPLELHEYSEPSSNMGVRGCYYGMLGETVFYRLLAQKTGLHECRHIWNPNLLTYIHI